MFVLQLSADVPPCPSLFSAPAPPVRVRAAIRRAAAPNVPDITGFAAIVVDFTKMEVMREDSPD
jgi:hypothetical protein